MYVFLGVIAGVALGVMLELLKIDSLMVDWEYMPGNLLIRALKRLVVPLVFTSDIEFAGKVSIVGFQPIKVFVLNSIASTVLGIA